MSATRQLEPESRTPQLRLATTSPKRGLHPNTLLSVIILGAVATVALWWRDTPSVSGLGDWLTNAGRITGLMAGYAVIVLLGLMARVPAVERGVGADRLARWHAMGGRYTVSLVRAHALLITWGYAITDHNNVFGEVWTLWTEYADVLMATVAGVLFVGVGITSARAARKRLRYETWLFIHFYTYLATALAFSHQFATGADFVDDRLARTVWAALYIAVAALLVWFRFSAPLRQSIKHQLRVKMVITEGNGVTTLIIGGNNLQQLTASSGQFFRWRFLTRDNWWATNPYSLSAPPRNNEMRITVKSLGDHSSAVEALKPGVRVIAEGPYGAMTTVRASKRKVLLIAGGVGISPLRALFEEFSRTNGNRALLIYRASSETEVLFRHELDSIARHYQSSVRYAIGPRDSIGDIVRVGVIESHLGRLDDCDVYICGPPGMTDNAIAAVRHLGAPRRRIHIEDFRF